MRVATTLLLFGAALFPALALPQTIRLAAGQWRVVAVAVTDAHGRLNASVIPVSGNPDLYVRFGAAPTLARHDASSARPTGTELVVLNHATRPVLPTTTAYVGVFARTATTFRFSAVAEHVRSPRPGMGATPYAGGTTFRVWAPFAQSVHVAGTFNGWSGTAAPLQREPAGHWSLDVRRARPGQEYKFVLRNGTQTLWRIDPRARQVTSSVGNGVIVDDAFDWGSAPYRTPNWNELVIYQLHVGTFNDAPGGRPGTFDTAIARLDRLRDLGVNAVKLLPVNEFPGDFSWGYNPSHPFSVESAYGGPLALKRFVREAHRRGIAVLLDVVHNHYGPMDLDLWRFDGWSQGRWGGVYFYADGRAVTPWGDTRPDFGRPEVRQYIRDNMLLWANAYRLDGFRWDSTLNMRRSNQGDLPDGWSLMQWLNNELDRTQPWKISIAEDLQENDWITRGTASGGAGFDSQWSAAFVHPVRAALETAHDHERNMVAVRDAITRRENGDAFRRVIYTESHDEVANGRQRVSSSIDPANPGSYWARKRSTLGAALAMTSPGIPMIFQGQEVLEDGWFDDRDPVDWTKETRFAGIRLLYRDLIALRRNLRGTTRGLTGQNLNVYHVNQDGKVLAFHRWMDGGPGDDVVVIANFANRTWRGYRIGLPTAGRWVTVFNSDWSGYSPDFGNLATPPVSAVASPYDGLRFSAPLDLAPYSVRILARAP